MMPASIGEIISWDDVFVLRSKLDSDELIHVLVEEIGPGVSHVKEGDELFLHEIQTDEISLKRHNTSVLKQDPTGRERKLSNPHDWTSRDLDKDIEIVLPLQYGERFILYPRYPLSHCFQSVQEILDVLPAVSKLIYPTEGFRASEQSIRALERLEIIDQIQDPSTGSEMLCVRSMKTEEQVLLSADMKISFMQLSNECYKCTYAGLSPLEFVMAWKAGQAAFKVQLCLSRSDKVTVNEFKLPKPKKDKKNKKEKHRSCNLDDVDISDLTSHHEDRWLIPRDWWDKMLLVKPYQKIRVKNITFDSKDFTLPESAKLMVKLLSANPLSPIPKVESFEKIRNHRLSGAEIFSGLLCYFPTKLIKDSNEPLLLMVTSGSMAISLRQQVKISQGSRLAVHGAKQSVKLLMTCSKAQQFLVSLTYGGVFRRLPGSGKCTVKSLIHDVLPREVEIIEQDKSMGYDQLAKRNRLTVTEIVQETTLCVELVNACGKKVSELPFEIPLRRTDLSVQVVESKSINIPQLLYTAGSIKPLPAAEFVSEADVIALRKKQKMSIDDVICEHNKDSHSPTYPFFDEEKINKLPVVQEEIYTRPLKTKQIITTENKLVAIPPPPRPPKSPIFFKKSDVPPCEQPHVPRRPPKPERFKENYKTFNSLNANDNNNNNSGTNLNLIKATTVFVKTIKEKEDVQSSPSLNPYLLVWDCNEKESGANKRTRKQRQSDASNFNESKNERIPLAPKRSSPLEVLHHRITGKRDENKLSAPESNPNMFIKLHNMFDPTRITENELFIINENDSRPTSLNSNRTRGAFPDVDTYIDPSSSVKPNIKTLIQDLKNAIGEKRLARGNEISNLNYDDKLELRNRADNILSKDEPTYEFAQDVPLPRKSLPSFTDDISDYEDGESLPRIVEASDSHTPNIDYECAWESTNKKSED